MLIPAPPGPRRQAGSRPPLGAPWPGGIRQLLFWCPSLCKQGPPHVPHWPHERVEATSTMCHASRVLVNPLRKGAEHPARGGGQSHAGATAASLQQAGPRHEPGEQPGEQPGLPSQRAPSWSPGELDTRAPFCPLGPRLTDSVKLDQSSIFRTMYQLDLTGSKQLFSNTKNRNWRASHVLR